MSKTAQRKRSMYDQGFQDAKTGYGFRWARHPLIKQYRCGFRAGRRVPHAGLIQMMRRMFRMDPA